MNTATGPGQTGRQPPGGPAGGRRAMSTGTGIFLIAAGAILRFALAAGSPHGMNLHVVGVILILSGALGLTLPQLARAPRDRLRRWLRPGQPRADDEPPTGTDPGAYDDRPALAQDPAAMTTANGRGWPPTSSGTRVTQWADTHR
jgi:hypothetical protein